VFQIPYVMQTGVIARDQPGDCASGRQSCIAVSWSLSRRRQRAPINSSRPVSTRQWQPAAVQRPGSSAWLPFYDTTHRRFRLGAEIQQNGAVDDDDDDERIAANVRRSLTVPSTQYTNPSCVEPEIAESDRQTLRTEVKSDHPFYSFAS